MKKIYVFLIIFLTALLLSFTVYAEIPTDKSPSVGSWQQIDNKWYFLDEYGNKKTGWIRYDNNWYYCNDATGEMLANQITPDKYFVQENGRWNGESSLEVLDYMDLSPDNRTYGWHKINKRESKTYFVKENGEILISTWACIDGDYYYFEQNGFNCISQSPEGFSCRDRKWSRKPSMYNPQHISPIIPEDNYFSVSENNVSNSKINTWVEYTNDVGFQSTRYIDENGGYVNEWQFIDGKWYFFKGYNLVRNKWINDYYVGDDGAMLTNTVTPDGISVDEDGLQIGKYKARSQKSNSAVDMPNYATYLTDGTQAAQPFVLIGIVNKGNYPITIYQKNASFRNADVETEMPCTSMKHYIDKDNSEICSVLTIAPKSSEMVIFYIGNDSSDSPVYSENCILQFGLEYNNKGYQCKVKTNLTDCTSMESVGMKLEQFK